MNDERGTRNDELFLLPRSSFRVPRFYHSIFRTDLRTTSEVNP